MATIKSISISPPRKPSYLASVKIELEFDSGETLILDDLRVLRNSQNQLWVGFPTYSIQQGRGWEYKQTATFDRNTAQQIANRVLDEFEARQAQSNGGSR